MTETATAMELKTCKVIVVEPGLPNSGIRIYPAEHTLEKVDTTSRPGQERWEHIQQIINRFSEPGKHIPKPLTFNPDHPKNTWNPAPTDDQLPLINLKDFVFKALPTEERPKLSTPDQRQKDTAARLDRLEHQLERLTDALLNRTEARSSVTVPVAVPDHTQDLKPRRGRPPKKTTEVQ